VKLSKICVDVSLSGCNTKPVYTNIANESQENETPKFTYWELKQQCTGVPS
jgi:hypothetical protein